MRAWCILSIGSSRHEHIYGDVENFLVRSDEFPPDPGAVERLFLGVNIILCTLSMLSNPLLHNRRVYDIIPVRMLIIDEASQINIHDYMVCVLGC
jgi:hypothetical protein